METSVIASFYRLCVLIGILGLILIVGWNQPLRYRFMSREQIYALENPSTTDPVTRGEWMWKDRQRALDRGPYNEKRRTLEMFRD